MADVEPEEDPQAKDWNTIGGWMFGLSFVEAHGGGRDGVSHWPGTSWHFARILLLSARASSERRVRTGQVCCFQSSIVACLRDLKFSTFMGFKNIGVGASLHSLCRGLCANHDTHWCRIKNQPEVGGRKTGQKTKGAISMYIVLLCGNIKNKLPMT